MSFETSAFRNVLQGLIYLYELQVDKQLNGFKEYIRLMK